MNNIVDIQHALNSREPKHIPGDHLTGAAVAMLLRETIKGVTVLFIERSAYPDDPWSGDLGFPGGKVERNDVSPRAAAERETAEELGFDLDTAQYLGQLSDVEGAHLPVRVSCFVYLVNDTPSFRFSNEIRDAFWVRLEDLTNQNRHEAEMVSFQGEDLYRPAIRLPVEGKPVLWGLTYRLIMQFLELLACNRRT